LSLVIPQPLFLRPGHQARLASNTNARGRPVPRPNWVLQTSYRSHLARQPEGMRRFSIQFGGIAPRNKRGMPEFWSIALSCCSEIDLYRQWLTVSTRPAAAPGPRPRDLAHSFGPDRRSSRRRGLHPLSADVRRRRSRGIHLEVSAFHLPRRSQRCEGGQRSSYGIMLMEETIR
jgi:hypothetical protein